MSKLDEGDSCPSRCGGFLVLCFDEIPKRQYSEHARLQCTECGWSTLDALPEQPRAEHVNPLWEALKRVIGR